MCILISLLGDSDIARVEGTIALGCGSDASFCWLLSRFQHLFIKFKFKAEYNILDIVQLTQHNGNMIIAFILHTNYIKKLQVYVMAIFSLQPCHCFLNGFAVS